MPAPATPPKADDYEARIRSDPEFALGEVKKLQGTNTKLYQQHKQNESLLKLADQLGGAEGASRFILEYDGILKHPEVAKVADHYRKNGVLPTAQGPRPESSLFEEQFPDPQSEELNALRQSVTQLQQQVSHTRGAIGKQSVKSLLDKLKTEYPDGFEEFVAPALSEQFDLWEKNPQGRELLATLSYDALLTVAGKAAMVHRDAIYEKWHARKLLELKRGATGAPSPTLSTGREPSPKSQGYVNAQEALAGFAKVDPEGPLRR